MVWVDITGCPGGQWMVPPAASLSRGKRLLPIAEEEVAALMLASHSGPAGTDPDSVTWATPVVDAGRRPLRDPDNEDRGALTVAPTQPRHGLIRVRIIGEIDMLTAGHLGDLLDAAVSSVGDDRDAGRDTSGETPAVVCDLAGVTFLGAAGLDIFVAAHRGALARDVRLLLVAAHRTVVRPIRLTALDRYLTLTVSHPGLGRGAPPVAQGQR